MADRRNVVVIDLTDEDEREYDEELSRIIGLTQIGQQSRERRYPRIQRNAPLSNTHRSVQAYNIGDIKHRVNDFFELVQPVGEFWKAQFLEVKQIWVSASGDEVLLRGLPYARNTDMYGRFECKVNEVCQILEIDDDDKRPDEQQAMIEVRPCEILVLRDFHKTNADYHSSRNCSFGNNPYWITLDMEKEKKKRHQQDFAPFTCRWKMRFQYHNASFRKVAKAFSTAAIHLLENDIDDPAFRTSDEERRKPTLAIDLWDAACNSYQRNFPHAVLFRQDIHDFIVKTEFGTLPSIDVLHISPPCQFYSPAKVNEGKDDEKNEVVLWSCGEIIERIRPRVFTMEQTYGLLAQRFTEHFNKLIQCFTKFGYSFEWQERVELKQYGLPQNRKRLVIIGAAPGEKLPPWPAPTHGPGRKPWVTEAAAINRFPRNVTLHDVQNTRQVFGPVRNPNMPLPRTILCSGAQGMIHYNGQRDYTLRELATLQGFPLNHEFIGPSRTAIKKQIGNAFPASVAKVFFQSIREFLERQDNNCNLAPPGSLPNNRKRPQHNENAQDSRPPTYSRLNGDLDEDVASQMAMSESLRQCGHQKKVVITIDDSDDEEDVDCLPQNMARLSVEPSQPIPLTVGESSRSRQSWLLLDTPSQPVFDGQREAPSSAASSCTMANSPRPSQPVFDGQRRAPSSAASSCTMANSPRPSPSPYPSPSASQQQSLKRKSDDQKGSPPKRVHDATMNDEVYFEVKLADRASARAAARQKASLRS